MSENPYATPHRHHHPTTDPLQEYRHHHYQPHKKHQKGSGADPMEGMVKDLKGDQDLGGSPSVSTLDSLNELDAKLGPAARNRLSDRSLSARQKAELGLDKLGFPSATKLLGQDFEGHLTMLDPKDFDPARGTQSYLRSGKDATTGAIYSEKVKTGWDGKPVAEEKSYTNDDGTLSIMDNVAGGKIGQTWTNVQSVTQTARKDGRFDVTVKTGDGQTWTFDAADKNLDDVRNLNVSVANSFSSLPKDTDGKPTLAGRKVDSETSISGDGLTFSGRIQPGQLDAASMGGARGPVDYVRSDKLDAAKNLNGRETRFTGDGIVVKNPADPYNPVVQIHRVFEQLDPVTNQWKSSFYRGDETTPAFTTTSSKPWSNSKEQASM